METPDYRMSRVSARALSVSGLLQDQYAPAGFAGCQLVNSRIEGHQYPAPFGGMRQQQRVCPLLVPLQLAGQRLEQGGDVALQGPELVAGMGGGFGNQFES